MIRYIFITIGVIYAPKLFAETDSLFVQCRSDLIQLLHQEERWIKVHAAEYLLQLGTYREGVAAVFHKEDSLHGDIPMYRIGIWRVLAQTGNEESHRKYIERIKAVFFDNTASDRLHAIESLAKLREALSIKEPLVSAALQTPPIPLTLYTKWNLANSTADKQQQFSSELAMMLLDGKPRLSLDQQKIASYIIGQLDRLPSQQWRALRNFVLSKQCEALLRTSLYSTLYKTKPMAKIDRLLKDKLVAAPEDSPDIIAVLIALSARGSVDVRESLERFYLSLSNRASPFYDADKHAASAYALYTFAFRNKIKRP